MLIEIEVGDGDVELGWGGRLEVSQEWKEREDVMEGKSYTGLGGGEVCTGAWIQIHKWGRGKTNWNRGQRSGVGCVPYVSVPSIFSLS